MLQKKLPNTIFPSLSLSLSLFIDEFSVPNNIFFDRQNVEDEAQKAVSGVITAMDMPSDLE